MFKSENRQVGAGGRGVTLGDSMGGETLDKEGRRASLSTAI